MKEGHFKTFDTLRHPILAKAQNWSSKESVMLVTCHVIYIYILYCLIGPAIESFRNKLLNFESKPSKMSFPNCPQEDLTFTSEACVSCTLPAAPRRRIPPCAGSLGPKTVDGLNPPSTPPLAKAANVDSPNGEAPRAISPDGH